MQSYYKRKVKLHEIEILFEFQWHTIISIYTCYQGVTRICLQP